MDQAQSEFDDMMMVLTQLVEDVRHNKMYANGDTLRVMRALVKASRFGIEINFEPINHLCEVLEQRSFDRALTILKDFREAYRVRAKTT